MRIPKQNRDLRRFVLRRDLKGLLLWLLWVLLWGTGAWAYNANHATYPPERQMLKTLYAAAERFYANPENQKAFEAWKEKKTNEKVRRNR